jgi:flagella basal body P-ring formation protein FlgA
MKILIFKFFLGIVTFEQALSQPKTELAPVDQVAIHLKEEVTLDKSRIYLSDIATCMGEVLVCQEGYGIEIARFTGRQTSIQLASTKILKTLESEWPLVAVSVLGSPTVKIHFKSSYNSLDLLLISKLETRFAPIKSLGFEVEIAKVKIDNIDPFTRLEPIGFNDQDLADPHWIESNLNGKKTITWAAFDESSEEPQNTYQSEVWFTLRRLVPAATRDLPKGVRLESSDLTKALVPISGISEGLGANDPDGAIKSLIGKKTKLEIKKGSIIFQKNTEFPVAIRKNQSVNVVINGSGLVVGFMGKSLQDGALGDVVEISYPNSKKVFKAKVLDEQNVEMIRSGSLVTNP